MVCPLPSGALMSPCLFGLLCQVFDRLSQEGRGKVTVFFCGSPALGDVLKAHSAKYNFAFRKENF